MDLTLHPDPGCQGERWLELLRDQPDGELLGRSQREWRVRTRRELHLDPDQPIIATGHQTLLWHPGILAKYFVVADLACAHQLATANLIVDQHVDHFGEVDVPVVRDDGSLHVRRLVLTPTRRDVPMGLQPPFEAEVPAGVRPVLPSVGEGLERIAVAVNRHQDAPNAAIQMARALDELMQRWMPPMHGVTATDLIGTSLGRAMLRAIVDDPRRMAEAYNRAVRSLPEAGIPPLLVRDDYVEVPLWRIQPDGRRVRAYDNDVEAWLDVESLADRACLPFRGLLPRAIFMTALVRLGMCDLFVHGTGGANYDRAMERWIGAWLGVHPGHVAVATATLRLPLEVGGPDDVELARAAARRAWHDPESADGPVVSQPGPEKRAHLARIASLPYGSIVRRRAFHAMHEMLERWRGANGAAVQRAEVRRERAEQRRAGAAIAGRRDWAFPLYPASQLDALSDLIRHQLTRGRTPAPACGRDA